MLHQVPARSIGLSASATATGPALFQFPAVSPYIIPRQEFCSHPLAVVANSYRILGHPVCLRSPTYPRNEFIFNFCLVLDAAADFFPHRAVTLQLARLLRTLEEQSRFLSRDGAAPNSGKIYALCEILLEDLNNYGESMIPIDPANTLNIKLFPARRPPPPLLPHHVPVSTVSLPTLVDENWDLTMLRILPYIDGVRSVRQIALCADADYRLVRKAVSHLLYYGCVELLDIFRFSAIYAPTPTLADFIESDDAQGECARYIATPGQPSLAATGAQLAELYCALQQGQTVRSFYMAHADALAGIDLRRFITFGVLKGILYRVQEYAITTSSTSHHSHRFSRARTEQAQRRWKRATGARLEAGEEGEEERNNKRRESGKKGIPMSILNINSSSGGSSSSISHRKPPRHEPSSAIPRQVLGKYLDGTHCFDEICTELMLPETVLRAALLGGGEEEEEERKGKRDGEVLVLHR